MRSITSASTQWLLLLAVTVTTVSATPYPRDSLHDAGYSYLMLRDCKAYCGASNELCCRPNEACTTLANSVATCVGRQGLKGRQNGAIVTTWTETHTYTKTLMTNWAPPPQPTEGVDCIPQSPEQEACGKICCAGWQTCAAKGQCSSKFGYAEPSTIIITSDGKVTTQYSAPYRITGTTTITHGVDPTGTNTPGAGIVTRTISGTAVATETGDGGAIGADGGHEGTGGGGLSPGAIAGIVIGVLAGVALLLLLAFCCIARGLWHVLFGKKKDKSHEHVDVYEERYSRHGSRAPSAYSRRDQHSGWFGKGGSPSSAGSRRHEKPEKKKSSGAKWLGLAGGAATLLALLNMKKDKKPSSRKAPSRYSNSYYSYDASTTSPSKSKPVTLRSADAWGDWKSKDTLY